MPLACFVGLLAQPCTKVRCEGNEDNIGATGSSNDRDPPPPPETATMHYPPLQDGNVAVDLDKDDAKLDAANDTETTPSENAPQD